MDTPSNSNASRVHSLNVYLIFTASGAAALIYQVIWARWLGLVFGNTATSVSIVLGSFMLGLALGSYIVGRRLHRIDNPMLVYAYLELGIGLFALCFPLLSMLTDGIFTSIVNADSSLTWSMTVRAMLAFTLLAVPTTFMGATLPLLTDFFRRDPRQTRSWKVGLLYAANTFGAAIGTIIASFILIELIGVRSTTLLAAALNFLVAYIGLKYARSTHLRPAANSASAGKRSLDTMGKLAVAVLAASGAIALASEVLWTRALEILIGNSTYAFAMILVLYLLGIAIGSWVMSLVVNRLKSLPLWLAALQMGMGIWIIIAIILFNIISESISQYAYTPVDITRLFWHYLQAVSILFPLAFFSGATFPVATRILEPNSEDAEGVLIAKAYAWNTIGALFGSLIAGFGIAVLFDYFQAIYLLAVLYGFTAIITVMVVLGTSWKTVQKQYVAITLGMLSLVLIGFGFVQAMEKNRFVTRFNAKNPIMEVVYHQPGLQAVTSALKRRDQPLAESLLVNGMGMTVKVTDTKMMAHLPMLIHPAPENTLVICFGMGTTYRSAISHGQKVTVVELVDEVFEAFDYFYADAERVRTYPKGQMITNDGRNFLKLTRERFDVITIDPPPPIDAAGVNHLYSKELLELARARLNEGGIMAHWIPFPSAKAGVNDWPTFNMLLATFASVYPHTAMLPGWHGIGLHVIGSMKPINISEEYIQQRLLMLDTVTQEDINEWNTVPITYYQDLTPMPLSQLAEYALLTDDRPSLEFNLLRYWRTGIQKLHPDVHW
ncbi:MAG: fused MFS/spermidine synthase [Candidatus Parabeggiatoa sp.]|nr:fused MFS/spermidine synthase [Candidatus Parabeggiatoa sp.]